MASKNETQKLERLFVNKSELRSLIPILTDQKLYYSRLLILAKEFSLEGRKVLQEIGITIGDSIDILHLIGTSNPEEIIGKEDKIVTCLKGNVFLFMNLFQRI